MPEESPLPQYNLRFEGTENSIGVLTLSVFLSRFRTVYRAIEAYRASSSTGDFSPDQIEQLWEEIPPFLLSPYPYDFPYDPDYFEPDVLPLRYPRESLRIVSVSKSSPLEITLIGIGIALTGAVILSGGKIEFTRNGVKCALPPLGKGIEALRRALRKKL
jgi:hypothetical protein